MLILPVQLMGIETPVELGGAGMSFTSAILAVEGKLNDSRDVI